MIFDEVTFVNKPLITVALVANNWVFVLLVELTLVKNPFVIRAFIAKNCVVVWLVVVTLVKSALVATSDSAMSVLTDSAPPEIVPATVKLPPTNWFPVVVAAETTAFVAN